VTAEEYRELKDECARLARGSASLGQLAQPTRQGHNAVAQPHASASYIVRRMDG